MVVRVKISEFECSYQAGITSWNAVELFKSLNASFVGHKNDETVIRYDAALS